MTAIQDRKKILTDFLHDVWSSGNINTCQHYVAALYTIHHDPGDPWNGQSLDLAGFIDRVLKSRAPFPDQRFDVQALHQDGNAVVATWLWTATHTGDLAGFPATGKVLRMSGATVYYFDESNRLTGHWQIVDRLGVFQQLQQARQS